jgi:hypothetical protein
LPGSLRKVSALSTHAHIASPCPRLYLAHKPWHLFGPLAPPVLSAQIRALNPWGSASCRPLHLPPRMWPAHLLCYSGAISICEERQHERAASGHLHLSRE